MTTVRQRYGYGQTDTQTTLAQQYRALQYVHYVLKAQSIQYATKKLIRMPGPYPEMWSGGSSAEGTRMETPKASTGVVSGEGVFPSPAGVGSGRGLCPLPRKMLAFSPSKWCILMHSAAHFRPTIGL